MKYLSALLQIVIIWVIVGVIWGFVMHGVDGFTTFIISVVIFWAWKVLNKPKSEPQQ